MFCPSCGTKNEDTAKYCQKCGQNLLEFKTKQGNIQYTYKEQKSVSHVNDINSSLSTGNPIRTRLIIKWTIIGLSVLTILFLLMPWVRFVGNIDKSYSLLTLPAFAEDYSDILYWLLYDIWDHDGAIRFRAFAEPVRILAIATLFFHVISILLLLFDKPFQKLMAIVSSAWALFTAIYYISWMTWFKTALIKYDGYTVRDVFHLTPIAYITIGSAAAIMVLALLLKRAKIS